MTAKAAQTVLEAAAQVFMLERTGVRANPVNAAFEAQFSEPERNPFLGWNPGPQTISSYQLRDAVLDGEFRGLLNTAGFIRGTGYLLPEETLAGITIDESRLVKVPYQSTVIIGCNVAWKNYFHWITQTLPAIASVVGRTGQDAKLLLALPALKAWQEDSLALLGYNALDRLLLQDARQQYAFDKVEYSDILNGATAFCLSDIAHRTYCQMRCAVERDNRRGEKIYVARTDAPRRVMRNEAAVIRQVRERGYEIVVPGDLTLAEQIATFRSARVVVGPHGAGLTNIVFCEPGAIVYELVPSHYANACMCNLAHLCRLSYWADAFESAGSGLPDLRHWDADLGAVIRRLDEIEAMLPSARARSQAVAPQPAEAPPCADPEDALAGAERAVSAGDIDGALAAWQAVRADHPAHPAAYVRAASVLAQEARLVEAELVLSGAPLALLQDADLIRQWAITAQRRGDLAAAFVRWQIMMILFPGDARGYAGLAASLREGNRPAAAEQVLAVAMQNLPQAADLAVEHANLASAQGNAAETMRRWAAVRDHFPNDVRGFTGTATALRAAGRLNAAGALLRDAVDRFPTEIGPLVQYAEIAEAQADWRAAMARWSAVLARDPANPGAMRRLESVRKRL